MSQRPVWLFSSGPVGDPNRKLVQKMTADPVELPELLAWTAIEAWAGEIAESLAGACNETPATAG